MPSVVIPAHDEAGWSGPRLDSLPAQRITNPEFAVEIVVVADSCRDDTAAVARAGAAAAFAVYAAVPMGGGTADWARGR